MTAATSTATMIGIRRMLRSFLFFFESGKFRLRLANESLWTPLL